MKDKSQSNRPVTGMLYDVDDHPKLGTQIVLAIQHDFAMFGATVLMVILVNTALGAEVFPIPVAICMAGVGTLIYQFWTRGRSPVFLGSSFAFISPTILGYGIGGTAGVMTALALVGVTYIVVGLIVKLIGKGWIDRVLPPVVIGPVIMVIGLGLSTSAISQMGLTAGSEAGFWEIASGFFTLAVAIIVMVLLRKTFFGIIPFLTAIFAGYIFSIITGQVDFTPVKEAAWFSWPRFQVMGFDYGPTLVAFWQIVPVALVTMAEHIGDHEALSTITGRKLLEDPGLSRTLIGDGCATLVAALVGGPPNTTYGENTAVVGMTRVASVCVLRLAAFFAIGLAFLGKFTALISTIPSPVLGGVSVLLYGFIALNGAKIWVENQVDFNIPRNVAITAPALVFGLGGAVLGNGAVSISGMSMTAVLAILLNLLPKDPEEMRRKRERERDARILADIKSQHLLEAIEADPELKEAVDQAIERYAAVYDTEVSDDLEILDI